MSRDLQILLLDMEDPGFDWFHPPEPRPGLSIMPAWMGRFLPPARYKSAQGGRGSAKSHSFAQMAVLRMGGRLPGYEPGPVRIASARQYQEAIKHSVKRAVERYISILGLRDEFWIGHREIRHTPTGGRMWFPGFGVNPESLMGVEDVDVLWIEQAERVGDEMTLIIPSLRKKTAELWFTWNPERRTDWCWKRFNDKPRPDDVIHAVNWNGNPWWNLTALVDERLAMLEESPSQYQWVYEGVPHDEDADTVVLPYSVLRACVKAYEDGLAPDSADGRGDWLGGLDLAFGGVDKCAFLGRCGPTIDRLDLWPGSADDIIPTLERAHRHMEDMGGWRLYYDAAGMPIRSLLLAMHPGYQVRPIAFGGAVGGPDKKFERGRPNSAVFARRNIQMAFALRIRAMRTARLVKGQGGIDRNQCLFIPPDLPGLAVFLSELTRPVWRKNPTTGKLELDKRGGEDKSPDRFDALCLAYAWDSDAGLVAR